jgi:hypothetical protein
MRLSLTGRKLGNSFCSIAILIPITIAIVWIIANCFKGLDLTDEGMYLLSASTTNIKASFHNPYADYTGLLLQLSGGRVWLFRLAGVVLIEISGMYLGITLNRVVNSANQSLRRWCLLFSGATIGIFYYATGLITPSYNWLNLLALVLGATACTKVVQKRNLGWADVLAFSAFLTTACWLGLFAKFTSAIGISLMALAVLLLNRNTSRDFLRIGSASIGMFAIYALSHQVFIEPWSITITKFVRGHKNLLLLDPGYSNERALDNFRFGIVHWFKTVPTISIWLTVILLGLLLISIVLRVIHVPLESKNVSRITFTVIPVVFVIAFLVTHNDGLWAGHSAKYINQMWAVSLLLFTSLVTTIALLIPSRRTREPSDHLRFLPVSVSIGAAVLYAVGSGNGFIAQLTGAAGFLLVAGSTISMAVPGNFGVVTAALVTVFGSFGAMETTQQANHFPYRQANRSQQNVWLSMGSHRGSLLVDNQMKKLVTELRTSMAQAGWKKNTPLLDLTKYTAGLVYLLEAEAPVTIIPTVGMYPTVDIVMKWAVGQALEDNPSVWKNAWLLTPSTAYSEVIDGRPNPDVVSLLGHTFPKDYEIVGTSYDLSIWKLKGIK